MRYEIGPRLVIPSDHGTVTQMSCQALSAFAVYVPGGNLRPLLSMEGLNHVNFPIEQAIGMTTPFIQQDNSKIAHWYDRSAELAHNF